MTSTAAKVPTDGALTPPAGGRGWRGTLAQVLGFLIGLALLGWCIRSAVNPENIGEWAKLRDAPPGMVSLLLALSAATMVINGAIFARAIRPIRRLDPVQMQGVNALATLLAYLPFKLSVLFRVLVHNRRDRLPLLTIAAWFSAIAAMLAVAVLPPLGASALLSPARPAWWAASIGGVVVSTGAMLLAARWLVGARGAAWLERTWRRLPLPGAVKGTTDGSRPGLLPRAREGLRILADGRAVSECVGLRVLDGAVHTARFLVAAGILGLELPADKAVIAGCAYFLVGAAAPSGTVGPREALTALLLGAHGQGFMVAVLMVSAAEVVVAVPAAAIALVVVKPWRLRPGSARPRAGGAGGAAPLPS